MALPYSVTLWRAKQLPPKPGVGALLLRKRFNAEQHHELLVQRRRLRIRSNLGENRLLDKRLFSRPTIARVDLCLYALLIGVILSNFIRREESSNARSILVRNGGDFIRAHWVYSFDF